MKTVLLTAAYLLLCIAPAPAVDEQLRLWNDPQFRRQFMGSYGVRADIEPSVSAAEKELMDKILALLAQPDGMPKAVNMLKSVVKPSHSAVFDYTLGSFYFQQNDPDAAILWYRKALAKFPSFLRAHKNLGMVYVRNNRLDEAVEPLTRAIELGANDGLTYGLLGFTYLMTEQFASALYAYQQAMMLQPAAADWQLGMARCLFKLGRFHDAAALCDQMIARHPDTHEYWILQANAYLGMGKAVKAAENYEYIALQGGANTDCLNTLGDIYVNEGLMELAADAYLRAMRQYKGETAEPFIRNAEVLAARSAHADAASVITAIREHFADKMPQEQQTRILKLEARLAAARGAVATEQIVMLEEIVRLDPLDGDTLILLGQQYAGNGQLQKAVFVFEQAATLESFEARACLRHAQALVRNAQFAEAVPLLKRAHSIAPSDTVSQYLEQVEKIARSHR